MALPTNPLPPGDKRLAAKTSVGSKAAAYSPPKSSLVHSDLAGGDQVRYRGSSRSPQQRRRSQLESTSPRNSPVVLKQDADSSSKSVPRSSSNASGGISKTGSQPKQIVPTAMRSSSPSRRRSHRPRWVSHVHPCTVVHISQKEIHLHMNQLTWTIYICSAYSVMLIYCYWYLFWNNKYNTILFFRAWPHASPLQVRLCVF